MFVNGRYARLHWASRVGKSSLILANQAKWRAYGLWAHAKFQGTMSAPFAALVRLIADLISLRALTCS